MERCSKPLRCYVSPTATSEMQKLKASDVESLAEIVPGWGHQISRHFRWCQVIWRVPWHSNCSKSSRIGKRVQAWLATAFPSDWATPVRSSMSSLPALAIWLEIYQMERCSGRLHWHWQSWILCWQSSVPDVLTGTLTSVKRLTLDLALQANNLQSLADTQVSACRSQRWQWLRLKIQMQFRKDECWSTMSPRKAVTKIQDSKIGFLGG